ncbi:MAG: HAMP domain-containing histidine kinase [Deltaproteobacteria bacterium]|nr:HAMP domain-containing histidine kinase [Deltaproteobacteria bacterium]
MFSTVKKILFRLETIDIWFLALRFATILAGMGWYAWVPYDANTRSIFGLLFSGFIAYTIVLYVGIFLWPGKIRGFYLLALAIDLLFIFFLIRYVGGLQESFFVAFYLLVGLHSFYFGLLVGLCTAAAATGLYAYLYFEFGRPFSPSDFLLRIAFLFLIAGSFGVLSLKERRDKEKIERLNQQLAHRNAVLMQVYRYLSIGRLAPRIAEKVNNPMAIIMGRAAVMKREAERRGLPKDVIEGSGVIYSHAHNVASMFKNLVAFLAARSVEPKMVDLNEIVKDALWLMEGRFEERHIRVTPKISQNPSFIRGDAQELHEAIVHLLNNAVDAMPHGGTIQAETSSDGHSSDQVLVRISDNGAGIRKEDMEKIFIPFFTTKVTGNGVGLGLTVALNIIKRHDGIMSVQSERGKGAIFTVSFPPYGNSGEGSS